MPPTPARTNATRLLERLGVPFEIRPYRLEPDDEFSAELVAERIGLPPEHVFKTLAVRGDRSGPMLAAIPGPARLSPKRLAAALGAGDRRVEPVPLKDVQRLTGYVRGAVTALALPKPLPVLLDASAADLERISVSAGAPGLQILIAPADYVRVVRARVLPIVETGTE